MYKNIKLNELKQIKKEFKLNIILEFYLEFIKIMEDSSTILKSKEGIDIHFNLRILDFCSFIKTTMEGIQHLF